MERTMSSVVLTAVLAGVAVGDERPHPLPPEVVAAWKKAGAEIGWVTQKSR
jgi:hypothetical protein